MFAEFTRVMLAGTDVETTHKIRINPTYVMTVEPPSETYQYVIIVMNGGGEWNITVKEEYEVVWRQLESANPLVDIARGM